MRRQPLSEHVVEAVIVLLALGLAFVAGLAGWAVGHASRSSATATFPGAVSAPTVTGHSGAGLPAHEFGDPVNGARLFATKGCADCHSYGGKGGTDAPPLDYMKGHLSAREIANMSGQIWNHLPVMLQHFRKEGIPVPTFSGYEMADLIAYLHSGSGAASGTTTGTTTGEMKMKPAKAK